MADADDVHYFRQRELRERALAEACQDARIGQIHMTMALRYASLVADPKQGKQRAQAARSRKPVV